MIPNELAIALARGPSLQADLFCSSVSDAGKNAPFAIVCHGFTAYRRYYFLPLIGKALASHGINTIVVDFSRNGFDGRTGAFVDPTGFSKNTFENERSELVQLIQHIQKVGIPEYSITAPTDFFVVGHSRGGVTALGAAVDPLVQSFIKRVSVWSTPSDIDPARFGATEEVKTAWRQYGQIPYPIERLGIEVPLHVSVLEEMEFEPERVSRFAKALTVPLLVVHGAKDERIPLACGDRIAKWAQYGQLCTVQEADHCFNVLEKVGASAAETSAFRIASKALVDFFTSH